MILLDISLDLDLRRHPKDSSVFITYDDERNPRTGNMLISDRVKVFPLRRSAL